MKLSLSGAVAVAGTMLLAGGLQSDQNNLRPADWGDRLEKSFLPKGETAEELAAEIEWLEAENARLDARAMQLKAETAAINKETARLEEKAMQNKAEFVLWLASEIKAWDRALHLSPISADVEDKDMERAVACAKSLETCIGIAIRVTNAINTIYTDTNNSDSCMPEVRKEIEELGIVLDDMEDRGCHKLFNDDAVDDLLILRNLRLQYAVRCLGQ